jgi:hypothetical protein
MEKQNKAKAPARQKKVTSQSKGEKHSGALLHALFFPTHLCWISPLAEQQELDSKPQHPSI